MMEKNNYFRILLIIIYLIIFIINFSFQISLGSELNKCCSSSVNKLSGNLVDKNSIQFFNQNIFDAGPIKICSDLLFYNKKKNTIIYQGNVVLIQIKKIKFHCIKESLSEDHNLLQINNSSKLNNQIKHTMQPLKILQIIKPLCQIYKGCMFLSGQKLSIIFSKDNKNILSITLKTNSENTVKFYALSFNNQKIEKKYQPIELYAEGKTINFHFIDNLLTIEKNAYIEHKGNKFSGTKIVYDISNGLVKIPDMGKPSIIMLNNIKYVNNFK